MEEDVAGRGHGMTRPGPDLPERVELRRPGSAEKPVPGGGTEPHYAGEVALEVPKGYRANEGGEVFAKASDGPAVVIAGVDCNHLEDRGTRQRRDHRLRLPLVQLAFQVFHSGTLQKFGCTAPHHPELKMSEVSTKQGGVSCPTVRCICRP